MSKESNPGHKILTPWLGSCGHGVMVKIQHELIVCYKWDACMYLSICIYRYIYNIWLYIIYVYMYSICIYIYIHMYYAARDHIFTICLTCNDIYIIYYEYNIHNYSDRIVLDFVCTPGLGHSTREPQSPGYRGISSRQLWPWPTTTRLDGRMVFWSSPLFQRFTRDFKNTMPPWMVNIDVLYSIWRW